MKLSGITRPIDQLGRVVIPKEFRRVLEIETGDLFDISIDGETILLNKYKDKCAVCGSINDLTEIRQKKLCKCCIEMIADMIK